MYLEVRDRLTSTKKALSRLSVLISTSSYKRGPASCSIPNETRHSFLRVGSSACWQTPRRTSQGT